MGVELEINLKRPTPQHRFSGDAILHVAQELYQKQQAHNPDWHNFYFETDGSLGSGGFEMITNPMTLEYHHQFWDKMLPDIRQKCVGWLTQRHCGGNNPYGIHITFHKKYWGDFRLARFIKFMENPENSLFLTAIAQRASLYSGWKFDRTLPNRKIKELCQIVEKKIAGSDRSRPIHVKGNELVEVRIFRSTLNTVSFFKNLEFIDAFLAWTKETGWSDDHIDFLAWLGTKPHHWSRYSNLLAYLARPSFAVWDLAAPLPNTWQGHVNQRKKVNPLTKDKPTIIIPEEDL